MKMKRKGLALLAAIAAAAAVLIFAGCPEPERPQEYSITIVEGIESITASHEKASAGTTITLTINPADDDYVLDTLKVEQADGTNVEVSNTFSFTMPASDVTVNGQFKRGYFYVNITEGIVNGTITADPIDLKKATAGTTITLAISPAADYALDTLSVKQADGTEVTVTGSSFTMPASDVTVNGQFKREYFYVSIAEGIANGTITESQKRAAVGTVIMLTMSPDPDYIFRSVTLSVKQTDGTGVTVTGSSNIFRFPMPASDVTVNGQFRSENGGEAIILFAGIADAETITFERDHDDYLLLGSDQSLTVGTSDDYDYYYWFIDGEPWDSGEDVNEITVPVNHPLVSFVGLHTITVTVKKGSRFYSENLPFRVVWW